MKYIQYLTKNQKKKLKELLSIQALLKKFIMGYE